MAHLRIFDSTKGFWDFPLNNPRIIIGREKENADCALHDPTVSRIHACINVRNGVCVIRDMNSTGGTFVNQMKIVGDIELKNGDVIRVGHTQISFMAQKDDDGPSLAEIGDANATIAPGVAQRFLSLPPGMGLNGRLINIPAEEAFHAGDTLIIGSGGIRVKDVFNIPDRIGDIADALSGGFPGGGVPFNGKNRRVSDIILELELLWPDGAKRTMMAEIIHVHPPFLYLKLHQVSRPTYMHLMESAERGSWISIYKVKSAYKVQSADAGKGR